MDISALQSFIAVARHQSFSKASQQLFVTQPAVSKRVAGLEEELGAQLFNRIGRNISLTEAGKQLLPRAQELVEQADEMHRYASTIKDEISGNLSIAIAHHIGLHRMPPVLREFNIRHPQVKLDIRFEDSDQAFQGVEQGDIEFAVITLPTKLSKNLIKKTVWVDDLRLVTSPEHALGGCKNLQLKQMANHPCVLPANDTETYKIIRREFDNQALMLNVQMQTNNLETLKMLAVAGLGWSLLPATMIDDSLKVLNLKPDLPKRLHRELGLVQHKRRSLSNAANALRNLICEAH